MLLSCSASVGCLPGGAPAPADRSPGAGPLSSDFGSVMGHLLRPLGGTPPWDGRGPLPSGRERTHGIRRSRAARAPGRETLRVDARSALPWPDAGHGRHVCRVASISAISASIRVLISSRMGRTDSTPLPAGSSRAQSRYFLPGKTGQASPQPMVMT